jgi:hypothetical protein
MAEPITGGGLVAVVSPGGVAGTVPEKDLQAAIDMGYKLEGVEGHRERRLEKEYGDRPLAAAGLGALSSVTFGGSDVVLGAMADGGDENVIREISGRNKGARMVGEVGGLLTGAGAAGLVTSAGKTAAKAAGGGAVRKAAVAGATEGGLLGVGQTVSHAGLSDDPLTAESVAGDLARNVLMGSGLGAGGGVLGNLLGKAAGKAREGLTRMSDDLAAAVRPGEKALLQVERKAEVGRLTEALVPERRAAFDELGALRADQKPFREALASRFASAPETVRKDLLKAERSLAGVVGNPRKLAAEPERALDAISAYETHLKTVLGTEPHGLGQRMLDRVAETRTRLEKLAAGPSSPKLAELDGRLAEIAKAPAAKTAAGGLVKEATQAAVFTGASVLADAVDLPGAGMLAFLLAGKIGGRLGEAVASKLTTRATEVGARIAGAAAKLMGVAERGAQTAIARAAVLGPEAFDALRDKAFEAAADPAAFEVSVDHQLDGVRLHDPVLADQLKQIQIRGAMHLAEVAPKAPGGPTLTDQEGAVSPLAREAFLRRAEVVMDPTTLLDAVEDGTLTPQMVQTGDAVYTELMSTLRGRLLEQLQGGDVSPHRRLVLSILLGAPASPSMRPEHIAAAQARINQDMAAMARRPAPGGSPAKPEEPLRSQRYAGGL